MHRFSHGESSISSSSGSAGAPRSTKNSLNEPARSPSARLYSSQYSGQPVRSPRRVAGERRRHRRVLQLGGIARGDPDPRPAARRQRGKADDVVLDDRVGLELVDDLAQSVVHIPGAVARRLERRRDERLELLDRRLPEHRRGVADEVLPELPGRLLDLRRRPEPHQPLLEPLRLERPGEGLLDDEHDAMAALAEHVADPDAVVRGPVGPLGKEGDRAHRAVLPHR
jgi:hypothetical protein